jgi:hypothetical protein
MDPTLVPAMPGIPPGVPLDFGAAFLPLLALLKIAGVAAVLLVAVAVVVGPPIQELLGMATIGTVVEPITALVLDACAALATLRWRIADALLGLVDRGSGSPPLDPGGARA